MCRLWSCQAPSPRLTVIVGIPATAHQPIFADASKRLLRCGSECLSPQVWRYSALERYIVMVDLWSMVYGRIVSLEPCPSVMGSPCTSYCSSGYARLLLTLC